MRTTLSIPILAVVVVASERMSQHRPALVDTE